MREDLYYRLNVYTIELAPLRDRLEDLPLLVEHFIQEFNREHNKKVQGMGQDCLDALRAQPWRGNVRELRNVIQRAVIKSRSATLTAGDLPPEPVSHPGPEAHFMVRLGSSLEEVQNELIVRTIGFVGGNKTRAAEILGVDRRSLYNLLGRCNGNGANGHSNGRSYRNGRNGLS